MCSWELHAIRSKIICAQLLKASDKSKQMKSTWALIIGGRQLIVPVQTKGGTDKIGVAQIEQDIELCKQRYPELLCRAIACRFITNNEIAMFEFSLEDGRVVKNNERRYKMIEAAEISKEDLEYYDNH